MARSVLTIKSLILHLASAESPPLKNNSRFSYNQEIDAMAAVCVKLHIKI